MHKEKRKWCESTDSILTGTRAPVLRNKQKEFTNYTVGKMHLLTRMKLRQVQKPRQ